MLQRWQNRDSFWSLYSDDGSRLLPRPISICEIDAAKRMIRLVYRVAGAGTLEFSGKQEGDTIAVVGPLGNGFTPRSGKSILIGGGIGIPPMLALAKSLSGEVQVVLGYRDAVQFLKEDFTPYASVYVSTEDGSVGTRQCHRCDPCRGYYSRCDLCVWAYADAAWCKSNLPAEQGIEAQISLEEHMACGIGACLGCVCTTKEKDAHSHVNNTRICKDGPVFDAQTVEI